MYAEEHPTPGPSCISFIACTTIPNIPFPFKLFRALERETVVDNASKTFFMNGGHLNEKKSEDQTVLGWKINSLSEITQKTCFICMPSIHENYTTALHN